MKYLFIFTVTIFLSSCATLISKNYSVTRVQTFPEGATIIVNKKDTFCCTEKDLVLNKEKKPVEICFIKDSLRKTILVDPKLSTTFLLGNLFTPYLVGYAVDLFNTKRLSFPKEIYVDIRKPNAQYATVIPPTENPLKLTFGLPLYNDYVFQGLNGAVNKIGSLGGSIGLEYYLSPKAYLSTQVSSLVNNHTNGGWFSFYNRYDYTENRNTFFVNARYNRIFERLHLGIGLAYQNMNYIFGQTTYDTIGSLTTMVIDKSNTKQIAASMSAHYTLSPNWYLGCVYQPMLTNFKTLFPKYQHYFNIELVYKMHIANTKNK